LFFHKKGFCMKKALIAGIGLLWLASAQAAINPESYSATNLESLLEKPFLIEYADHPAVIKKLTDFLSAERVEISSTYEILVNGENVMTMPDEITKDTLVRFGNALNTPIGERRELMIMLGLILNVSVMYYMEEKDLL
jgi:hypothetical protein